MKKSSSHIAKKTEQGFSLIEVMVAMAVGIILLGAVGYLFIGSRTLNRTQNETSRMQENARFALDTMGRTIRQAGARRTTGITNNDIINQDYSLITSAINLTQGANGNASDSISVSYYTQNANEVDCNGNAIATETLVTFVFTVDTTNFQLTCSNGAAAAVPIVDGVENMKVTVGVDTSTPPDGSVDSYVTPNNVPARSAALTPWQSSIAAVRVGLLFRSVNQITENDQTYTFNGASTTATDKRQRQVYNVTYNLRNLTK